MTALLDPGRETRRSAVVLACTVFLTWALAVLGVGPATIFATGLGATAASERHYLILASKQYAIRTRAWSGVLFAAIWLAFVALGVSSLLWARPAGTAAWFGSM